MKRLFLVAAIAALAPAAHADNAKKTSVAGDLLASLTGVNDKLVAMAEDFPEDKYNFRIAPESRSFGEMLVHVMAGNVYAAKVVRGEAVKWGEVEKQLEKAPPKGKAAIAAAFKKSASEAAAALKALPEAKLATTIEPWISVLEHNGEHYGQLVAYYRANKMVPPDSRPKKK